MANCFNNFIGIKCVSQANPKSGLFIDDLEGINLRFAADTADAGYSSGVQMLESKIKFATQLVLDEIARFTLPYFRMNSIVDELVVGEFQPTFLSGSTTKRGVRINTRESRLLRVRVQSVKIRVAEGNESGEITIIDGTEAINFPFVTDNSGNAEIFPNYLSQTAEVFVVMDTEDFSPNNTKVKGGCSCSTKKSEFLVANGWNGTSTTTTSFGLVVQANAECSVDEIGCILAQKIRFAVLYKSGIEIVKEALTTDRLNSVTLLDSDKCKFLLDEFEKQYKSHFDTAVQTLPTLFARVDDICILCNQSRYVYGTP